MSRRLALALLVAALTGCPSAEPTPAPAPTAPATTPTTPTTPTTTPVAPATPATPAPPATPQVDESRVIRTDAWQDDTQGATATLVYVTEQGRRGATQPAAIILSSDEGNPHFKRENSARVTVHRLTRADMGALLADLSGRGFDALPWSEQPYDAQIGPQRAFYLYRDGRRTHVDKDALGDAARRAFTALERRIIEETTRDGAR
jgi:hypothetical protein